MSWVVFISALLLNEKNSAVVIDFLWEGGVYPSTQSEFAMMSEADYFILSEGEISMAKLIDCFTSEILEGIIGLNSCCKSEEIVWSTPNGIRIDTLDEKVMEVISRTFFSKDSN